MKRILSTEGLVLAQDISGENHIRITLFSKTEGRLLCMQRKVKKNMSQQVRPDLFDQAQLQLDVPLQGHVHFIKEYQVAHRYSQIGKSYDALLKATELAKIVSQNLEHAEFFEALYNTCLKAFSSFEKGHPPAAILLKSLYLLARDEGYPIKERWYQQLEPTIKNRVSHVINTPLAELNEVSNTLSDILKSLKNWLKVETDFIV